MSSVHAITPSETPCEKCGKPSVQVEVDIKGNVTLARCALHTMRK